MKKRGIEILVGVLLGVWAGVIILAQNPPNPQTTPQNLVVTAPPPTGPVTALVTNVGVTAQVSYCYWVVAVYPIGMSPASAPACTSLSNGTLGVSNYNRVTWSKPPGAVPTGYWVVRARGNTFPGSGTVAVNTVKLASNVFALNDQSNTLHTFSFVNIPYATGVFSIDNTNGATPVLYLTVNGIVVSQWVPSGGLSFGSIGNGTNHSAAMIVGSGASLVPSGGTVDANQVNGGSVPGNQGLVGTNNLAEFIPVPMPLPTTNNIYSNYVGTNGSGLFQSVPVAPPTASGNSSLVYSYQGNVSTSGINSGTTIVAATTAKAYRVVGFQLQAVGGSTGTCTSIDIGDGSGVIAAAIASGTLTSGTVVTPASSNVTFDNYAWQGGLTSGQGIKISKSGGSCDTLTSLNYAIQISFN
jgi:hypothetical protein